MGKQKRGSRSKQDQDEKLKARKKLKRDRLISVVHKSVSNTPYVMRRCRNEHASELKGTFLSECPATYKRLTHGRVVIQDKATNEIALVVCFTPFQEMSTEVYSKFEELTSMLAEVSEGASNIAGNGAHRGGGGIMKALGWRVGFDRGLLFSRYVPAPKVQRSKEALAKWEDDQRLVSKIAGFYKTKFNMLAPELFKTVATEALFAKVPDLEQTEFVDLQQMENTFASNLTYSYNDFYNRVHCDHDHNSYTYGIWAPTNSTNGKLASVSDGFNCNGGEFVVPSYEVYIDFGACDGIVEAIWRGKTDYHCTTKSTTTRGYTRIGSSVQISQRLVSKLENAIKALQSGDQNLDTINTKIKGADRRIKDKLALLDTDSDSDSNSNSGPN
jgi:hypothetical protein